MELTLFHYSAAVVGGDTGPEAEMQAIKHFQEHTYHQCLELLELGLAGGFVLAMGMACFGDWKSCDE